MNKEQEKYSNSDLFYQHYDEILDKVYQKLVDNGTIDPNKYQREFIEHYYSYDENDYFVYEIIWRNLVTQPVICGSIMETSSGLWGQMIPFWM